MEQNRLPGALLGPDDTLTKAMKLMFPDSRSAAGKFLTVV